MTTAERAAVITMGWTAAASALALPLLFVPSTTSALLPRVTVHLFLVVAFAMALAFRLAPLGDGPWFDGVPARWRSLIGGVWLVVLVAGAAGLVALATSAALRYDPSLQFLQVLSALDIAWAGAAIVIGLRWLGGLRPAIAGATILTLVCVWSIWRYLDVVGFGANGSWVVDGDRLATLVLPYDIAAAVMAVTALLVGDRALRRKS